jgi:hypothetical protein
MEKLIKYTIITSFFAIISSLIAMVWIGKPEWLLNLFSTFMILFISSILVAYIMYSDKY